MKEIIIAFSIASLLIGFHVIIVTVLIARLKNIPPIAIHAISAVIMLALLLLISFEGLVFNTWLAFCMLAFGVSAYLFLFGAVYKSLSLRLLLMTNQRGGQLSLSQLNQLITEKSFIDRAELLCEMGLVTIENNNYKITHKGLMTAKKINLIRKIFNIRTSGLYQSGLDQEDNRIFVEKDTSSTAGP